MRSLKRCLSSELVYFLIILYVVAHIFKIKKKTNQKKPAGAPNTSEYEISAHATHTVSDYQSSRPVSTPWAPTDTAGAPSPRGDSDLLTASCIFFQFRHLPADFTASAHES